MDVVPQLDADVDATLFEQLYLDDIAAEYGQLAISGIDLSRPSRRTWPLATAYMSLAVSDPGARPVAQRAEQALAGKSRILLHGAAGTGKTTVLRWLAVSAARRAFQGGLAQLNGCVPFLLPVRGMVGRTGLPAPGEFLAATGIPLHADQPPGWVERALRSGRALLLVDGVDEVPQGDRQRVGRWLEDLLAGFPDAKCIVTSRPAAIPRGWLARQRFQELTLLPLNGGDASVFISRWHQAVRADSPDPDERARLTERESALLQSIQARQDLQRLTKNPLICAVVCALNAERRPLLQGNRVELLAALSMLLVRRDSERDVTAPEGVRLSEARQRRLLKSIAYWLVRNGRYGADRSTVLRIIDIVLPTPRDADGEPEQIWHHLLMRTGLLQLSGSGAVEFVDRAFQDYLAAQAALECGDLDVLLQRAEQPEWRDVFVLAVAVSHAREREALLMGLLRRADRERSLALRIQLHVSAAAAVQEGTQLSPGLRRLVMERTAAVVPMLTPAQDGGLVFDLLPFAGDVTEEEALAILRTADLADGEEAEASPRQPARHRAGPAQRDTARWQPTRPVAQQPVVQSWPAASTVSGPSRGAVEARSSRALYRLIRDDRIHQVTCQGDIGDLGALRHIPKLRTLLITDNPSLTDLGALRGCQRLRVIVMSGCPRVRDFSAVAETGVVFLGISPSPSVEDLQALSPARWLRALQVSPLGPDAIDGLRKSLPSVEIMSDAPARP